MRFLLLVLAFGLAGCNVARQPKRPKSKTPDAVGRKLVVVDSLGTPLAKVRLRKDGTRVYGTDMVPFGMVVQDDYGIGFHRDHEPIIYLAPDPSGIWDAGESLRIEPVDVGWAVFGIGAKLIGYVDYDNGWTFRRGYVDTEKWTLRGRDIVAGSAVVCSGRSGRVESEMTLALCIEALPIESRTLLGVWLQEQNRLRTTTAL